MGGSTLPGFVTAWVFYAFTSYPKPSQFERVIQALIFTLIIQFSILSISNIVSFVVEEKISIKIGSNENLAWSVAFAISLGLLFSYFANNDKFHKILRWAKITKETSYSSEWFSAFSDNITYTVLHLDDGRRIYGWPIEWPTEPNAGHFLLEQAVWLTDDNKEIETSGVESILVDAKNVKFVEFMKNTWES